MGEEKKFENKLKAYLKSQGCWVLKTWGGGYQRSGLPDLLCCYKGKFIAIEVKSEIGKASELQKYEIEQIRKAEGFTFILKPSHFEDFKNFLQKIGV